MNPIITSNLTNGLRYQKELETVVSNPFSFMYYESRGTLATQNINFKVCVTRFEDLRKTIAGNNRLDK